MSYFLTQPLVPRLTCIEKGNHDVSASLADERLDRERHGALVERGIYLAKLVSRIQRSFKKLEWGCYNIGHRINQHLLSIL